MCCFRGCRRKSLRSDWIRVMSYSIFGAIQYRSPAQGSDKTKARELAILAGLFIQVSEDITDASVIAETLKEQMETRESSVPYYILDRLGSDTSHDLISPGVEGDWNLARARIERNLLKIGNWLGYVLTESNAQRISIFISEDYDDSFITLRVTPQTYAAACIEIIDKQSIKVGIPGIKALVEQKLD